MNHLPMYGEGSCTSFNAGGNRNPREEDCFFDQLIAVKNCQEAGTHRYQSEDGAYRMKCFACGDTYMHDKVIFR